MNVQRAVLEGIEGEHSSRPLRKRQGISDWGEICRASSPLTDQKSKCESPAAFKDTACFAQKNLKSICCEHGRSVDKNGSFHLTCPLGPQNAKPQNCAASNRGNGPGKHESHRFCNESKKTVERKKGQWVKYKQMMWHLRCQRP